MINVLSSKYIYPGFFITQFIMKMDTIIL